MPTSATSTRSITSAAYPGVRVHVSPAPGEHESIAILGALHQPPVQDGARRAARTSPWHRAAMRDAVGDGRAWSACT